MVLFDEFEPDERKKLAAIWKVMSPSDRDHFINQAALGLSIWGSDERGREVLIGLIRNMLDDGSKNLADFGLYLEYLETKEMSGREDKFKKAMALLDNYRFKHDLPSEPSKEFVFSSS